MCKVFTLCEASNLQELLQKKKKKVLYLTLLTLSVSTVLKMDPHGVQGTIFVFWFCGIRLPASYQTPTNMFC